jgi:DNA segregation ATPase FtsK/SpoIIIE, S-DNA-T family
MVLPGVGVVIGSEPSNPFAAYRLDGPRDFLPAWDVPSFGQDATHDLLAAIREINDDENSRVARAIHVLLAPPGYGKTHLFGRIARQLDRSVLFVFIPAIEDTRRPLHHIRWWTVEGLFRSPGAEHPSALAGALAALCQPSFIEYLSALPPSLAAHYKSLRGAVQEDPNAALEIVAGVRELSPFQKLADSLVPRFRDHDANIIRAMALGWSPAAEHARRWLRGESLAEEHAEHLRLPEEPPSSIDVLCAAAELLASHAPVVLCLDQLDVLLADDQAPARISIDLMTLLGKIPNLLIILSCLKVEWKSMEQRFNQAFLGRTRSHELTELAVEQSIDLVRRRLADWPGRRPSTGDCSPFEERSLRAYLDAQPQAPRSLIQECRRKFESWLEEANSEALILMAGGEPPPPILAAFRHEWDRELEAIRRDVDRSPDHIDDGRLCRMIKEGLQYLQAGTSSGGELSRLDPRVSQENPVGQTQSQSPFRYSLEVRMKGSGGEATIVVAIVNNPNKASFGHFYKAASAAAKEALGVVWVTPFDELPAGPAVKTNLDAELDKKRLRVLSLLEFRSDFERLLCYLSLLDRASRQELLIEGRALDVDACRQQVVESAVLENLGLFAGMLGGWIEPTDRGARSAPTPTTEAPQHEVPTSKGRRRNTSQSTLFASPDEPSSAPPAVAKAPPEEPGTVDERRLLWADHHLKLILKRLSDLKLRVGARYEQVQIGPSFARFIIEPLQSTTVTKVRNRAEDLKIVLGVDALPLINSQPDGISIDVQLPDEFRQSITFDQVGSPPELGPLAPVIPVGVDVSGTTRWMNFADANDCHLLVAGTTGSGKSEFLRVAIAALAARLGPARVKFVLVDPKQVTFNFRRGDSRFLLKPILHDPEQAVAAVKECFAETERRFTLLRERFLDDLAGLQAEGSDAPPRIFLVFDEFADLMADKEWKKALEAPLRRIGAKSRAAGIHLIMATQRPEASVVTPLLRSNLPGRVALRVASRADSNLIIGETDAADLLGRGDLLWRQGAGLSRLQSPFISRDQLEDIFFGQ